MTADSTVTLNESSAVEGARPDAPGQAPDQPAAEHQRSGEAGAVRPLLELRHISKSFGAVRALNGVDLDVVAGQVVALVGDNGAGKSTLIKVISGIWEPDQGEMYWNGEQVQIRTPREAAALGIQTVYQDLALCDNLDIVQNMFLGREGLRSWFLLDESAMEVTAKATLTDLSVTTVRSIRQPVGSLSGGQRQAVAVARAVMWDAKLVIMDEPTAALGVAQTAMVLELIGELAKRGVAVLLISHNLNDVFAVADDLAILHLGRMVASGPVSLFDTQSAVELITTGARVPRQAAAAAAAGSPEA
jgi:ABC-type sugar transport system ATPase subunit